jgi:hypothetical protein
VAKHQDLDLASGTVVISGIEQMQEAANGEVKKRQQHRQLQ